MNTKLYIIIAFVSLVFYSCAKEDPIIVNENTYENYFAVRDDATDEESNLRREFFNTSGAYLLFTDTLRKELMGNDLNGNPVYFNELVDLGYGISVTSQVKHSFEYFETIEEKKAIVDFINNKLIAKFSKDAIPYSFLIVKTINQFSYIEDYGWSDDGTISSYSGLRTSALALGDVATMDEDEQNEFVTSFLKSNISAKLTSQASVNLVREFTKQGEVYYGKKYDADNWDQAPNIKNLGEIGLISGSLDIYENSPQNNSMDLPSREDDIQSYIDAIFDRAEADFNTEYETYPLVIERYNLMKKIIKKIGFNIE